MDIFKFNAEEAAGILQSTPGGVYSAVQRARRKIASIDFTQSKSELSNHETNITIQLYLKAFNNGDLDGMLKLFSEQAQNEAYLGFQESSKDEMLKGSLRFGLPGHTAREFILWNKPVIIVFANGEQGPRKEFILAAAKELGIKAQLEKPPVDWS